MKYFTCIIVIFLAVISQNETTPIDVIHHLKATSHGIIVSLQAYKNHVRHEEHRKLNDLVAYYSDKATTTVNNIIAYVEQVGNNTKCEDTLRVELAEAYNKFTAKLKLTMQKTVNLTWERAERRADWDINELIDELISEGTALEGRIDRLSDECSNDNTGTYGECLAPHLTGLTLALNFFRSKEIKLKHHIEIKTALHFGYFGHAIWSARGDFVIDHTKAQATALSCTRPGRRVDAREMIY